MANAKDIKTRFDKARGERGQLESIYRDIFKYILPREIVFSGPQIKNKPTTTAEVYDSTAIHSIVILANSMEGLLTDNKTRWFNIKVNDKQTGESLTDLKKWSEEVEQIAFNEIILSNFRLEISNFYKDLVSIGTAAILSENDSDQISFRTLPINEYYIGESTDDVFRILEVPDDKGGKDEFIQSIFLNRKLGLYENVWIDSTNNKIVDKRISTSNPIQIGKFSSTTNSVYGECPSFWALPDVKTLNKAIELILKAWSLNILPPILTPETVGQLDLTPGAQNAVPQSVIDQIRPFLNEGNSQFNVIQIDKLQENIKEFFFTEKLKLTEQRKTATEAQIQFQIIQTFIQPLITRLEIEVFKPLIKRTIHLLSVTGKLPALPGGFDEVDIDVEIIGSLQTLQKQVEIQAVNDWAQFLAPFIQSRPDILDNINFDKITRDTAELFDVKSDYLLSETQTNKKREERQALLQAQAEQGQKNV